MATAFEPRAQMLTTAVDARHVDRAVQGRAPYRQNISYDPLERLGKLLIDYYPPIEIIEHKYRTKVTAVGLLKNAGLNKAQYIEPYYQRLMGYMLLVKDHIDHMKLSLSVSFDVFRQIFQRILNDFTGREGLRNSSALDMLIELVHPQLVGASLETMKKIREEFVNEFNSHAGINQITTLLHKSYLNSSEMYDLLAQHIVRRCLTGVKQEDIVERLANSVFNYFVYGYHAQREGGFIYEVFLKSKGRLIPKDYFTRVSFLARLVISEAEDHATTVNFFGRVMDEYDEIRMQFSRKPNISVLFF